MAKDVCEEQQEKKSLLHAQNKYKHKKYCWIRKTHMNEMVEYEDEEEMTKFLPFFQ